MSEIAVSDDEAAPDLGWMVQRALRLAARAIRAGRAGEALRWLSVHTRLEAMADAADTPDPARATARPEPSAPVARPADAALPAAPEVHQLHQLHRALPVTPVQSAATGPDPP